MTPKQKNPQLLFSPTISFFLNSAHLIKIKGPPQSKESRAVGRMQKKFQKE